MANATKVSTLVKTLADAIQLAHAYRNRGGCFDAVEGGYLVMWNVRGAA